MIVNCRTQFAAIILEFGIVILLFKNHTPIDSINIVIIIDRNICIEIDVENILFNLSMLLFPNSYVMNLLMAEDSELDRTENIVTTPPTTL